MQKFLKTPAIYEMDGDLASSKKKKSKSQCSKNNVYMYNGETEKQLKWNKKKM